MYKTLRNFNSKLQIGNKGQNFVTSTENKLVSKHLLINNENFDSLTDFKIA